jgi:hypothetical protein
MNTKLSSLQLEIKNLQLVFYDEIKEMPFHELETKMNENFLSDYIIVKLKIQNVISKINGGAAQYTKFCLDKKMENLISFIKTGNKIIPPILVNISKDNWTILDGQHRVALSIFLNNIEIPFLIRKQHFNLIDELS